MMLRVAWRSLLTRPVRAFVLASGFGFGIAVMVSLLGVGEVILDQAHAPALAGGGDLVVSGRFGPLSSARFVLSTLREVPEIADRVAAVSPVRRARVYLSTATRTVAVTATGGVPGLERELHDPETSHLPSWMDLARDAQWSMPSYGDVLRSMDRFHPIPARGTSASSWVEWLYFNGRTPDGRTRVYVTFFVAAPIDGSAMRAAAVRVQLDRDGRPGNYSVDGVVDARTVLAEAPDLDIGGNQVRLDGSVYRIVLKLPDIEGVLTLDPARHQALPPAIIRGANGWETGYVVPALAGKMSGTLRVHGSSLTLSDAIGYHDHNWGFWQGVRWQWGQVAHDGLSIVYGRIFPPSDVADPSRVPAFLGVLDATGLLGYSTNVDIDDTTEGRVDVRASQGLNLRLSLEVGERVSSPMEMTRASDRPPLHFIQMGGVFHVTGTVGSRSLDFEARGSAETFRP
jgi:hypothetical protein